MASPASSVNYNAFPRYDTSGVRARYVSLALNPTSRQARRIERSLDAFNKYSDHIESLQNPSIFEEKNGGKPTAENMRTIFMGAIAAITEAEEEGKSFADVQKNIDSKNEGELLQLVRECASKHDRILVEKCFGPLFSSDGKQIRKSDWGAALELSFADMKKL